MKLEQYCDTSIPIIQTLQGAFGENLERMHPDARLVHIIAMCEVLRYNTPNQINKLSLQPSINIAILMDKLYGQVGEDQAKRFVKALAQGL